MTCICYLIIFEDPQVALNPFKPPLATPVRLAGILPPTEIPTAAHAETPTATPIFTSSPTATASPTATPTWAVTPLFQLSTPTSSLATSSALANPPTDGKWIDVDIGNQTISAYLGGTPLKTVLVSTGIARYPTVIGQYQIYVKVPSQTMRGGNRFSGTYYYLPGVPSVMYFYQGYAIHGTYWHHNFGQPMSHGCVNLTIEDAKWFYDWAEVGTTVVTHS